MQHTGPIAGVAAHGKLIATAGYDNQVILWNAEDRTALARANHDHLVNHCAFSANGQWLVSASSDCSARVWAVPSMRLHAVLPNHGDDVDMAVFSPTDDRIATCALDRCVRIFDRDGRVLHEMHGHTGNVLSVVWSADGRHVVSSSVDGTIRKWNAEQGVQIELTDLHIRTDSVEMASDGTVYAGDDRGRIAILQNGNVQFIKAHRAGVKKVALDAKQGLLVSLSYDQNMAVWQISHAGTLTEVSRTILPTNTWARTAVVLDDGRVAVGTFGSSYALYDTARSTWDMQGVAAGPALNAVLCTEQGVYTVGDAGQVRLNKAPLASMGSLCNFLVGLGESVYTGGQMGQLFDARTAAVLYEHHSPLNCGTAFSIEGVPHLAVGTYTGEVLLFTVKEDSSVTLHRVLAVYENAVKGLGYADGVLFSVCASTDVAWHNVTDGRLVRYTGHAHERIANACCAVGPNAWASVSRDRHLRILFGNEVMAFSSPHQHSVKCLAINADRTLLATGSYGGTVALFDLVTRSWRPMQRPTASGVSSLAWNAATAQFVAASYDGHTYQVSC